MHSLRPLAEEETAVHARAEKKEDPRDERRERGDEPKSRLIDID